MSGRFVPQFYFLLLCLPGPCLGRVNPAPASEIHWYLADVPAVHMAEGDRKNQGFLDQMLFQQLIPGLSNYRHVVQRVPVARREGMLKSDPLACAPGLFKSVSRGDSILYSSAYMTTLPPGLFSLPSRKSQIQKYTDKAGLVNLHQLLSRAELALGSVAGRSYGTEIDKILVSLEGKANIYKSSSEQALKNLKTMLQKGRVDLILANPYEPGFVSKEPGVEYIFWPIKEQSAYELVYAACAHSPEGRERIKQIGLILAKTEVRTAADRYFESWLKKDHAPLIHQAREKAERDGRIKKNN